MGDDTMRYDLLAQEAMRGVVRLALQRAAMPEGLPGEHHFFITFLTRHPGVVLPPHLRDEYPDEMTVVIKRHYWDLSVDHNAFSVGLSFHGKPEVIRVPYSSVLRFQDPEGQFSLQFPRPELSAKPDPAPEPASPASQADSEANVVSLDAFRKR